MGSHRLVRFSRIDFFVRFTERADAAFHLLDEPKGHAPLLAAGPSANRALNATLGHGTVAVSNVSFAHGHLPHGEIGRSYTTRDGRPSTFRARRLPPLVGHST